MTTLAELQQHVARCFARYENLPAAPAVLAAVSGGVDSSVLALALQRLAVAGRLPGPLVLAHVDHGQHPRSADALAHVAAFSRRLGAGFLGRRLEGVSPGASEDALRTARYRLLAALAAQCDAGWIVTAHHADDDVETVLFRMLRGTGLRGLAGIPEHRQLGPYLHVLRPFLEVRRAALEKVAAAEGVVVFDDPTNQDLRFARNALRAEVIPALRRAGLARDLDASLFSLARTARSAAAVLDAQANRLLRERGRTVGAWRVELDLRGLVADDEPFLEQALRLVDVRLRGDAGPSSPAVIARVLRELRTANAGQRVHGKGEAAILFERTRDGLLVLAPWLAGTPPAAPVPIEPGIPRRFGNTEWRIALDPQLEPDPGPDPNATPVAWLDLRRAPPPWFLRTRRTGERFQPLGMDRPLELKHYLQSHRVPRFDRDRMPLLVDGQDRVLWVPGVGLAAAAALTGEPRACVRCVVERG